MDTHLKKAIERDNRTPQAISPISKFDGEIFFEIVEVFKKLGQNKIVEELKKYKKVKDSAFYETMLDINTNFNLYFETPTSLEEEDKPKMLPRVFLSLKNNEFSIDIFRLRSIQKFQQYNTIKLCIDYCILINPAERVDLDSNIVIFFDSKKERDKEIENCKILLHDYNISFIN